MKKNVTIILLMTLLFVFSCKSQPKAALKDETKKAETSVSVAEGSSATNADGKTSTGTAKPAPEKVEPKPAEPKPAEPKVVEPKVDPAKAPAEAELKKAEGLLAECTKAGVPKVFPSEFNAAKADVNAAKDAANAKNYAKAKASAVEAQNKLQTLLNLNAAANVKSDIATRKFEGASAQEYTNAEIAYIKAGETFGKNTVQALNYSKTALQNYESVLSKGYVAWVKGAFEAATKSKAQCDSIKASKAAATEYAAADKLYVSGKAFEQKKNYDDAYSAYIASNEQFTRIYDKVSVLRAEALKAMERASAQQQISSELAAEADVVIPLKEGDPTNIKDAAESVNATQPPAIENAPADTGSGN